MFFLDLIKYHGCLFAFCCEIVVTRACVHFRWTTRLVLEYSLVAMYFGTAVVLYDNCQNANQHVRTRMIFFFIMDLDSMYMDLITMDSIFHRLAAPQFSCTTV